MTTLAEKFRTFGWKVGRLIGEVDEIGAFFWALATVVLGLFIWTYFVA